MQALRRLIYMSMALGMLALLAMLLGALALIDVEHGESNLALEWGVVRAAALLILKFIALALITLRRILKTLPECED
ncbi:MAG: hypothetical protein H6695_08150 [Deferribacteres bacterium]|nr:hypothetical protein [candidate division KSB1 bacterium]MCB9510139.1 hypothetical protein [Deferribacteres bacterium]